MGRYIFQGATGDLVEGNYIGTNVAGTAAIGNHLGGVDLEGIYGAISDNTIGGPTAAAANVISGNSNYGIYADSPTSTGNFLENNYVGTGRRQRQRAQYKRRSGHHQRRRRAGQRFLHGQRD